MLLILIQDPFFLLEGLVEFCIRDKVGICPELLHADRNFAAFKKKFEEVVFFPITYLAFQMLVGYGCID